MPNRQLAIQEKTIPVYPKQYLDYIHHQIGSPLYQTPHPSCINIPKNQRSSVANFVSRILLLYGMIRNPQIQINILLGEMKICGWIKSIDIDLDDLIPGDIIFYGQDRSGNNHLSFFVDSEDGLAIGMYGKKQCPILHSYEFEDLWHGKKREILARFTLENKIGGKHERHFFG